MEVELKQVWLDGLLVGEVLTSNGVTSFFGNAELPHEGYKKAFPQFEFHFLRQEHGGTVRQIGNMSHSKVRERGDALISSAQGKAVAIYSSDCLPILLHHCRPCDNRVAAIHAGWRGLISGVVPNTISALCGDFEPSQLFAYIGPHIRRDSYQIRQDVAAQLRRLVRDPAVAGLADTSSEFLNADLAAVACAQLADSGVRMKNVFIHPECTYSNMRYSSFRRSPKRNRSNVSFCGIL